MKKGFFEVFAAIEAPRGLYETVMHRLAQAERRAARMRLGLSSVVALGSFLALIPVVEYTLEQFAASGFYTYLSLLFSDSSIVLTFWHEFALSLIESLPSLALALLIPLTVVLVWSVRRVSANARAAFA